MRIRITEQQRRRLFEAMKPGFRVDILRNTTYSDKIRYCKEMLGNPVGNGSSRMVFQMDDETVLKLAKNQKGIAQNMEEIRLGTDNYLDCFPRVMNGTDEDNGLWIICEYVLPAKAADFKKVLGVSFDVIKRFCYDMAMVDKHYCVDFHDNDMQMLYNEYEDNYEVIEMFDNIRELCYGYEQNVGDLMRIANWGFCMRDGEPTLVILDYGFSHDVQKKYYNWGR